MEFRLTYAGALYVHKNDSSWNERSVHKHDIRRIFHKQLKALWGSHPVFSNNFNVHGFISDPQVFRREGFEFIPIVTEENGLICKLEVLLLRKGKRGDVMADIDNRLKTIFDALRMPKNAKELGEDSTKGQQKPATDETPFYVLLEDDKLITHVAVTNDLLLEEVPGVPPDNAARVLISVTVKPYDVRLENLVFA